ncbi:MAG: shikimate dehydrogenase [Pseudomonadota bacterium]
MKNVCVIGHPISHSLSPVIHNYWIERHSLDARYTKQNVKPENLADFIEDIRAGRVHGANVTIPHKEHVLGLIDHIGDAGRSIGAVNTLWRSDDGRVFGDNSDRSGFFEHLSATHPDWRERTASALVLGAGGAARAILSGLTDANVSKIAVANRTLDRAERLAKDLCPSAEVFDYASTQDRISEFDLIINTSALGMTGQPALPLRLRPRDEGVIVCDIVFSPLETELLAQARQHGFRTVDGLGMLLHQAKLGFSKWFSVLPMVDDALRSHVLNHLQQRQS